MIITNYVAEVVAICDRFILEFLQSSIHHAPCSESESYYKYSLNYAIFIF